MPWKQLDASKLRNVGGKENAAAFRVFGKDGKKFPRLVITLRWTDDRRCSMKAPYSENTLTVSIDYKHKGGSWWEDGSFPPELIPDLIEMLEEVRK